MSRRKLKPYDKKVRFGISLNPNLMNILKTYSKENNIKTSRLIEDILREHFKKQ